MSEQDQAAALDQARAVKQAHEQELLSKANVVGVGVGLRKRGNRQTGDVAIVVMVRKKVPAAGLLQQDIIPAEIDGVPVDVQEVGDFQVQ